MVDKAELRRIYNECSKGGNPPTMAVLPGELINKLTGSTDYVVGRLYLVTKDGITEFDPENGDT